VKILHVVPSYLPAVRYGGPIVSVHGLCKALARQGHDVQVFTTNVDGPNNSAVPLGVPVDLDGVKVHYFPVPALRRLYWSPRMRESLGRNVKAFDIVHTHSVFLWPTWAAARAASHNRVPYIVSPRGMLVRDLVERKSTSIKKAWISLVERRNLEEAAVVHVTSQVEADELAKFGFNLRGTCIVPNGVDLPADGDSGQAPSKKFDELAAGPPYLLFVGRINWKKGLDRIIAALALLPEIRLIVAGNDEEGYQPTLEALAKRCQVTDRIRFVGPAYGADKQALFRHALTLVVPSYSENFGNVAVEAMAAGCPVIATREVGAAGIVSECGAGIVVESTPEGLASGIASLVADPQSTATMGQRGKIAVSTRFTWDAVAKSMESVYKDLLAQHG
jgi:glycosyltransferase involved in cell wall biosynthesis